MIVARHEVPGVMRKIARRSGTIERLRLDANNKNVRIVSGTDNDFDRPSGTGAFLHRHPGTSCLATISVSSGTKAIHPSKRLALS
jgi:hypothetical protein